MIEPFFFHDEKLFGCYHPSSNPNSSRLLIICPPFFDEYRRSFKAISDLASACSERGVHVLRFDFFGTGESQGTLTQASVEEWLHNIDVTIDEGIALSGADEVLLIGVRFGATLAAQSNHQAIKRYIFWDPIDNGLNYLKWLSIVNENIKQQHTRIAKSFNQPLEKISFENFFLTPKLVTGIAKLKIDNRRSLESFVITTSQSICDSKTFPNCEFCGLSYDWPPYHDGILTQKPVLEAIARRVLEQ